MFSAGVEMVIQRLTSKQTHGMSDPGSFDFVFFRCDKPFTATINVQVEKENVEWSHVFNSGEEMAVGKTDIYVKVVELKDEDGKLQV